MIAAVVRLLDDRRRRLRADPGICSCGDDRRGWRRPHVLEPAVRAEVHAALAARHPGSTRTRLSASSRRANSALCQASSRYEQRSMCSAVRRSRSAVERCSSPAIDSRTSRSSSAAGRASPVRRGEEVADREVRVADLRHHLVDARLHELPAGHGAAGFHVREVLLAAARSRRRAAALRTASSSRRRLASSSERCSIRYSSAAGTGSAVPSALTNVCCFKHVERAADDPADVVPMLGFLGSPRLRRPRISPAAPRLRTASRLRPSRRRRSTARSAAKSRSRTADRTTSAACGNWKPRSFSELDAARRSVLEVAHHRIVAAEISADHQVREIPQERLVRADPPLVVDGSRLQTEDVEQVRERVARRIDVRHLADELLPLASRPWSAPRAPGAETPPRRHRSCRSPASDRTRS